MFAVSPWASLADGASTSAASAAGRRIESIFLLLAHGFHADSPAERSGRFSDLALWLFSRRWCGRSASAWVRRGASCVEDRRVRQGGAGRDRSQADRPGLEEARSLRREDPESVRCARARGGGAPERG